MGEQLREVEGTEAAQPETMVPEQPELQKNGRTAKNPLKKDVSRVCGGLLIYMLILNGIVIISTIRTTVFLMLRTGGKMPSEAEVLALVEDGMPMILGVMIGTLLLTLMMRKQAPVKEMFQPKKKMTVAGFFGLLAVFMSAQFVFSYISELLEAGLNLIGYSAMESIESATGTSSTVSMFVYAAFVGPFVEELIYRGFVLDSLKKYGKLFAIVVSSLLFGVMHANLPQALFAFSVGLVLAYTASEYSLTWAIVLHIANNFVFAELMGRISGLFGEKAGTVISGVVIIGFFIAGLLVLWKNRVKIGDYISKNRTEKGKYRMAFTTVTLLLFVGINLLAAFSMLKKLP